MKRLVFLGVGLYVVVGMVAVSQPAHAITEFNKKWQGEYLTDDTDQDFVKTAKKAGCNVCHVKGEDKKKVRNEYGQAVHEFLKAEDFPKEYLKSNPDEAAAKIIAGLKKAGEKKSSDGKVFADKIKSNELPATDAGI